MMTVRSQPFLPVKATANMASLVASRIRGQIVRGELREGDELGSESELAAQLQVSRPTLREAIRVLEAENLIVIRRGVNGGCVVQTPSAAVAARYCGFVLQHHGITLAELLEARTQLEVAAARAVGKRANRNDIRRLRSVLDKADTAESSVERAACHDAFHVEIQELAGNRVLSFLSSTVSDILAIANRSYFTRPDDDEGDLAILRRGQRAHERLVSLLENGDLDAAERLWERHLREVAVLALQQFGAVTALDIMQSEGLA